MNTINPTFAINPPRQPDERVTARRRFIDLESSPLFLADWMDVLFIHFQVDRERLQATVPFQLDCVEGEAFVSLVAFSMRALRPAFGGAMTAIPFKLVDETRFLNVRTYVRHDNEPGAYCLKQFMSNRLGAPLGPLTYGLPCRPARLDYTCRDDLFKFDGRIRGQEGDERRLRFQARFAEQAPTPMFDGANEARTTEFLTEKYTAYTCHRGHRGLFRIWHAPWSLREIEVEIEDRELLQTTGDWLKGARLVSAQYSPGARDVRIGPPHTISQTNPRPRQKHRHTAFLELP